MHHEPVRSRTCAFRAASSRAGTYRWSHGSERAAIDGTMGVRRSLPIHKRRPSPVDAGVRRRALRWWMLDLLPQAIADQREDWKTACVDAEAAYSRWASAPSGTRASAYTAYRAALDREEHASTTYRDLLHEATACQTIADRP
jgi:hypothetical protein